MCSVDDKIKSEVFIELFFKEKKKLKKTERAITKNKEWIQDDDV